MTDSDREKCEGCGIAAGGREKPYLFDHRGYRIYGWCWENWERKEERLKRDISLEEYQRGIPGGLDVLLC